MRVVPKQGHFQGAEGMCPPLPFVTVDDEEGTALVASGVAVEYDPPAAEPEHMPEPKPVVTPKPAKVAKAAPAPAAPEPVVDDAATEARTTAIRDAVDLLDEGDFEAEGDRAGKPKLDAVKAILGDEAGDLTTEEIDAAVAAGEGA